MNSLRSQLIIGLLCMLLGVMLVTQFRTRRLALQDVPTSASDQATFISQLYDSNAQLRSQVSALSSEIARYEQGGTGSNSNYDSLVRDLQNLRMANGAVELIGPGVTIFVDGEVSVLELQDLVNELRNASAEAISVNGVRVVTRSALIEDEAAQIVIDRQLLSRPYRLEAIGDPDTLGPALQRKGGLIALLQAGNPSLEIEVIRHQVDEEARWVRIPRSNVDPSRTYARPLP
jgi:uncharacterized protein YlxW (UPF0749 family)